ncbi:hypothetical protein ACHWQZ_G010968 [Mnemiopsis leidyi]
METDLSKLIKYSEKYCDSQYEYRHVSLPEAISRKVPSTHLLTESEWRNLGVQQSPGWVHYMIHPPEKHILLFRRPISSPPPRPPPVQEQAAGA